MHLLFLQFQGRGEIPKSIMSPLYYILNPHEFVNGKKVTRFMWHGAECTTMDSPEKGRSTRGGGGTLSMRQAVGGQEELTNPTADSDSEFWNTDAFGKDSSDDFGKDLSPQFREDMQLRTPVAGYSPIKNTYRQGGGLFQGIFGEVGLSSTVGSPHGTSVAVVTPTSQTLVRRYFCNEGGTTIKEVY